MDGWDAVRSRLIGDGDGRPMIFFFDTCVATIRTLPVLQHDPQRVEDLDTSSEDHAADAVRYGCLSRPWLKPKPVSPWPQPSDAWKAYDDEGMTLAEMGSSIKLM
jgi:hypothetical protein